LYIFDRSEFFFGGMAAHLIVYIVSQKPMRDHSKRGKALDSDLAFGGHWLEPISIHQSKVQSCA